MPMMQVGVPTQTDSNQVTTKPRQLPGGSGGDGVPPGGDTDSAETPFGEGDFEPDSNGSNIAEQREENSATEDDLDGGDAAVNAEPQAPAEPKQPATTKPSPVVARVLTVQADVLATNPGLDRRMAMVLASEAVRGQLVAEGIYEYDPGMHTHDFNVGESMFNRYLRDMHKLLPDPPQEDPEHPGQPHPHRPSAVEDAIRDRSKGAWNKVKQHFKPPKGPGTPPSPEADDKQPAPASDPDQKTPMTMGEFHRKTMEQYPSTQRDLWEHRHDPRPYKPEGYPEAEVPIL